MDSSIRKSYTRCMFSINMARTSRGFSPRITFKPPWWLVTAVVLILLSIGPIWTTDQSSTSEIKHYFTTTSPSPQPTTQSTTVLGATSSDYYPVVKVTDGDTIKVLINDTTQTVRLVGINTPETVDPRRPIECMGQEASDFLKQLLTNQRVRLEPDSTQADRDRYGRLLRFVFLESGEDVGLIMLQQGLAQESLYSDVPHRYRAIYLGTQATAQEQQRGLWADGACNKNANF